MNNDHHLCILLCTCITVSDFIFLRTRVYRVEGMTIIYYYNCTPGDTLLTRLRGEGAKDLFTHVTHHPALLMQP